MGEVSYVWADPNSPSQQVALSALVKAMDSCPEDASKIKGALPPLLPSFLKSPSPSSLTLSSRAHSGSSR